MFTTSSHVTWVKLVHLLGQVEYIDYGNKEVVSKDQLRVLDAEFMSDPVQCYCCRLHDVVPVTSLISVD